MNFLKI